jgi:RNA polymerase sigma factor (TIGR02999 family)
VEADAGALPAQRRMSEITRVLHAIEQGDPCASEELLPLVYDELRRLAAQKLAHERPGQTLQPTALVHEAYLRLVSPHERSWDGSAHFFAAAAEAMRRILIDNARRKARLRHGGDRQRCNLKDVDVTVGPVSDDILALDEALTKLAQEDPIKVELVKLRYFAGLNMEQSARMLGISRATAERYWRYARAWLYEAIHR